MEVGDLATWISSVGTVGALSVALWQTLRQRRVENARQSADALVRAIAVSEDRRRQAELISAWISDPGDDGLESGEVKGPIVSLLNASNGLIYELVINVYFTGETTRRSPAKAQWVSLRNDAVEKATAFRVVGALQPGYSFVRMPYVYEVWKLGIQYEAPGRRGVEVAFTDSAGRHWLRDNQGLLSESATGGIDRYAIERPIDYAVAETETVNQPSSQIPR